MAVTALGGEGSSDGRVFFLLVRNVLNQSRLERMGNARVVEHGANYSDENYSERQFLYLQIGSHFYVLQHIL